MDESPAGNQPPYGNPRAAPSSVAANIETHRARIALSSIVVLTLFAGLPGLGPWSRLTPDSFTYLDAARCLRETGGYSPFRMIAPPGFSTLLAPLLTFGDPPLLAARLFNLACWIATAVLTFLLFRRHLGMAGAWLTAALVATSPTLAVQSTMLLSEPAFVPLVLGCLVFMDSRRWPGVSQWIMPVSLGLLCSAATLVRTMGIVLAPLLAIAILTRVGQPLRRRALQAGLFAAVFAVPIIAWELRQSGYPDNNSYSRAWVQARSWETTKATGLKLQAARLSRFGPMRLRDIKGAIVPPHLGWRAYQAPIAPLANGLVGGLLLVATLWRCWRFRHSIDFFVLATLAMLCLWPYDEGPRMVLPLLPMFFAYLVWLGQRAMKYFQKRPLANRLVFVLLAAVFLVQLWELGLTHRSLPNRRDKANARLAAMHRIRDWQEENLPKAATFACVIQLRHDDKTILIGGSYLSHRRLTQTINDLQQLHSGATPIEPPYCFVQSKFLSSLDLPGHWSRIGAIEGFDVYDRSVRIMTPQSPPPARGGG